MRSRVAYAIVFVLAIAFFIQPAMAHPLTDMASPFVSSCDFIYMSPVQHNDLVVAEFNSISTVAISAEHLNIDFPVFSDGIHLGPSIAGHAKANVLPFGPVNLALPSISQTAFDAYAYQRTYFFTDVSAT